MSKLDKHFNCPKSLKVAMLGLPKEQKTSMYEAHQSYLAYKNKAPKSKDTKE